MFQLEQPPVSPLRQFLERPFAGLTPLTAFLLATIGLAGWLGYQALDAAASHRRTAEQVLTDYAQISATELARITRGNLNDLLDETFGRVVTRVRVRRARPEWELDRPSPSFIRSRLYEAADDQRCECIGFRNPIATFTIDLAGRTIDVEPDTLGPAARAALMSLLATSGPMDRSVERDLVAVRAGEITGDPVVVGYLLEAGPTGAAEAAYGFVVTPSAIGEIFRRWYEGRQLLPQPIARDQPNDSLLHVRVQGSNGVVMFSSPVAYPTALAATIPLGGRYDGIEVRAAVRPDAASQLIIGGLPSSRLPLLAALLMLTLGVGVASVIQLRREQEFQRLRDDFVSGVSHELRTPLAQIRMFSELQEARKLTSEEDRQRAIHVIHRESRRLSHLVENILQFSRLRRTNGQGMPKERLDLAESVAEGVDAVTPLVEDRGSRIEVTAEEGLEVFANRDAITRIVVNLLDNALKYGPPGQTIRIVLEPAGDTVRLSVSDEGPGVPASDRERVWKPYRRLERDIKARVPGSGIGLSVVSQLALLHGGRVWVDDAVGGGARFVVELPLASSDPDPDDREDGATVRAHVAAGGVDA